MWTLFSAFRINPFLLPHLRLTLWKWTNNYTTQVIGAFSEASSPSYEIISSFWLPRDPNLFSFLSLFKQNFMDFQYQYCLFLIVLIIVIKFQYVKTIIETMYKLEISSYKL